MNHYLAGKFDSTLSIFMAGQGVLNAFSVLWCDSRYPMRLIRNQVLHEMFKILHLHLK